MIRDRIQNAAQIPVHIEIGQSQHSPTAAAKIVVTTAIVSALSCRPMRLSIHFDNELRCNTGKICNVGSDRVLTPEFHTVECMALQTGPQDNFRVRHLPAQCFGEALRPQFVFAK